MCINLDSQRFFTVWAGRGGHVKKTVLFAILLCTLSGCMPNMGLGTSADADNNVYNLSRLTCGMTEKEVLCIMRCPYCDETFIVDGDTYDVWFYVTEPTVLGQSRMVPLNLTPLTFKNGKLVGWGYSYYNYLRKRELSQEKPEITPPPAEKAPETEDIDLEKTLKKAAPGGTAPSPQIEQKTQPDSTPSPKQPVKGGKSQPKRAEPAENLSPLERQDEQPKTQPPSPPSGTPTTPQKTQGNST